MVADSILRASGLGLCADFRRCTRLDADGRTWPIDLCVYSDSKTLLSVYSDPEDLESDIQNTCEYWAIRRD